MRIDFVTLFPEMVLGAVGHSILARAQAAGLAEFWATNPRDFATDKHRTVDDSPYGGGPGMVMMAPVVHAALESLEIGAPGSRSCPVVLTDPAAPLFGQREAQRWAHEERLVFVCGHYEGIDERVRERLVTEAYSIGDYVLTGGELPALVMADAVVRLLPGVLGDPRSHEDDSHADGLLGFPLYTKPAEFLGSRVPEVLTSGDHAAVARWRRSRQLARTREERPDLFSRADLRPDDLGLL
ncbi:MAG: tRNA (guanosine(37)-N1)-methyltransferase TrmD [Fimbriimonadaceae bacterium]|nr:tRNA (guanosine(37)-N1)-methyltransferase TrmD [Fimbriimonadaceae bacterium]QYK59347.1 MAG: tRNA (guanosine(37)-N1)-methyltransferase TrmD [Fimbriimonadaceae bacterium]